MAPLVAELFALATAVLAAGLVTGLLAGLFGIGGGAVIIPVLYEVFRIVGVPEAVRMQLCLGTSLAIMVPTTLRSYRAHRARQSGAPGVLRLGFCRPWSAWRSARRSPRSRRPDFSRRRSR